MSDEHKRETLVFILIFAFNDQGYIERPEFHATARDYIQRLETAGFQDLGFYFDLVTTISKEVEFGICQALHYQFLGPTDEKNGRCRIRLAPRMFERLLASQKDLQSTEIALARRAADESRAELASGRIKPAFRIFREEYDAATD